jgi:glutathione S-transferase
VTDGDFHLAQGAACVQYASQLTGLWPTDLKEAAHTLSLVLYAEDHRIKYFAYAFQKDEQIKEVKKTEFLEFNTAFQKNLIKHLNGKKFFGGDKVNGADLSLFTNLTALLGYGLPVEKELHDWVDRVYASSTALQDYFKKK